MIPDALSRQFYDALKNNNVENVQQILNMNVDVNSSIKDYENTDNVFTTKHAPLYYAVLFCNKDFSIIDALIKAGADVNEKKSTWYERDKDCLYLAINRNRRDIVDHLLSWDAKIESAIDRLKKDRQVGWPYFYLSPNAEYPSDDSYMKNKAMHSERQEINKKIDYLTQGRVKQEEKNKKIIATLHALKVLKSPDIILMILKHAGLYDDKKESQKKIAQRLRTIVGNPADNKTRMINRLFCKSRWNDQGAWRSFSGDNVLQINDINNSNHRSFIDNLIRCFCTCYQLR